MNIPIDYLPVSSISEGFFSGTDELVLLFQLAAASKRCIKL